MRATVLVRVPAKINLFLRVIRRREDGFHEIETVMQSVGLWDTVELAPLARAIRVECDWPGVPTDRRNLAWPAAEALQREPTAPADAGVAIRLRKQIPPCAGLGGGSADAAATLLGVARLWGVALPPERAHTLAAALGSDVPFFLSGGACLATGRGEVLSPLPDPPPWGVVIVTPDFGVVTGEAYAAWRPAPADSPALATFLAAWRARDLAAVAAALRNDLAPGVTARHPEIARIRSALLAAGALGAQMTGSGSAVFGLCASESAARAIAAGLGAGYGQVVATRLLTAAEAQPITRSANE